MNEIGLQDLIYQVKRELLAPNPRERGKDPYPLFFIDKIDLEISVNISRANGGHVKFSILDFAEIGGSKAINRERGHVVKVSLSPLGSREKILHEVLDDPKVRQAVKDRASTWIKGGESDLAGPPE